MQILYSKNYLILIKTQKKCLKILQPFLIWKEEEIMALMKIKDSNCLFFSKHILKNEVTSNIKNQKVLTELKTTCDKYLRDSTFKDEIGFVKFHPRKKTLDNIF